MTHYVEAKRIKATLEAANTVVIIQADNPDGDSLASSLALEQILGDLGKTVHLYCAVDMPDYLKHLPGWDRVSKAMPAHFDVSVIVDTSASILLEKLDKSMYRQRVATKPVIIIDHHAEVTCDIPYASLIINDNQAVATGEVIYRLADQIGWPVNLTAKTFVASSILADSLGLSSEAVTADTYRLMADLIEAGVDRPALDEARRAVIKMPESIFRYKAQLIKRTELLAGGRLAFVTIPHDEIMEYSPLYNPAPLIQTDMLQTENVQLAIVLKQYKNGRITGSIRSGGGANIAAKLAEHFGGGGHAYAAGFKLENVKALASVKAECVALATDLLNQNDQRAA